MCYNVPLYFERKNIKISDIFYLTRQNPHTIITLSSGESITTTIPIKELMLYLPEEDFLNISKGVVLRKNQIVHISDEGLYTMTDGAVFQGRKRNLSQHKQIRKSLGLNVQKTIRRFQKTAHFNYLIAVAFSMICHLLFVLLNLYLMRRDMV